MSDIESAAGRESGGSGSKRGGMSGLACSIKRRIADTETFDADVMPDKKIDKTSTVHFLGIDASASRAERKTGSIFLKNNGRNYYDQCHP